MKNVKRIGQPEMETAAWKKKEETKTEEGNDRKRKAVGYDGSKG